MAWQPKPADPKTTINGYEVAIVLQNTMDMDEVAIIYRKVGEVAWNPMGASDGSVWMGDFISEVSTMGFLAWLTKILALIQERIDVWFDVSFPTAPTADPKTFAEFQAWAASNIVFNGKQVLKK